MHFLTRIKFLRWSRWQNGRNKDGVRRVPRADGENQLTGEENALVSSVKERFGQEIPEDEALQSMEEALTEYESLKQTIRKGEFTPAEQNEWGNVEKTLSEWNAGEGRIAEIKSNL